MKHFVASPNTKVKYRADIEGFNIRWTQRGFCVLEVDYNADPQKRTKAWFKSERRKYTERDWKREMLRDWTTAEGDAFFPEFATRPDAYTMKCPCILDGPVVRGWDFGYRAPACVWMQVSPKGRVMILREILPFNTEVHEFRDLVRYLSGQVSFEYLIKNNRLRAMHWVHKVQEAKEWPYNQYPKPPWFKGVTEWLDFGGHEARGTKSIQSAHNEKPEVNDLAVLASGGINLNSDYMQKNAREYKVRRLLGSLDDGYAGLLVDPAAALLLAAFKGALAYPKATPVNPSPRDPAKDGVYDNIWDAASYGVGNSVEISDTRDVKPLRRIWEGRQLVKEGELDRVETYFNRRNRDMWL